MEENTQAAPEAVEPADAPQADVAAPVEGAEPVVEAAPEATPPAESAADQRLSQKFAALSRKEKQVRDRERAVQQQMADLQKQMETLKAGQSEVEKYRGLPERFRKAPLEVMKETGMTPEQLSEILMNGGKPTEEMERTDLESKIMKEIRAMQEKFEAKEKAELDQKYQEQLGAFVTQLTDFANTNPDYDLIRANDGIDLVYQVIEQHHAETGEILSNKDACDAVEQYYLDEAKKLVDREKVKKLMSASSPAPKPAQGKPSPTLSNTQASQVPTKGKQNLSYEESLKAAAELIRWED